MGKSKTPSFVLTIEMEANNSVIKAMEDSLEIARVIYNSCLGELLKKEKQMKREKKYKKIRRCIRAVSQKIAYFEEKEKVNFFVKKGEMASFEGKNNSTGWIYRNKSIMFDGKTINLRVSDKDVYMQEALSAINNEEELQYKNKEGQIEKASYKVKYVQILKRFIRGSVQCISKVCKNEPKRLKSVKKQGNIKEKND